MVNFYDISLLHNVIHSVTSNFYFFLYTGLIIANQVQNWIDEFNSLRLSQILDMYYSDEGIILLNKNVKVCDRRKALSYSMPKTLLDEQVSFILCYIEYSFKLESM